MVLEMAYVCTASDMATFSETGGEKGHNAENGTRFAEHLLERNGFRVAVTIAGTSTYNLMNSTFLSPQGYHGAALPALHSITDRWVSPLKQWYFCE